MFRDVPKKFHPPGYEFIYEDQDLMIGNKAAGLLTVAAKWNKDVTAESMLSIYVRKGAAKSTKRVYVVHRLDQDTTGLLMFAKSEKALQALKAQWPTVEKTYLAIVHRHLAKKEGVIESYLSEDEDYHVHSSQHAQPVDGALSDSKLARTEYKVLAETPKFSLVKLTLHTGRKNQLRVHMAELGHPIVGDKKYGPNEVKNRNMMLHAARIEFDHPHTKKRLTFEVKPPRPFQALFPFEY